MEFRVYEVRGRPRKSLRKAMRAAHRAGKIAVGWTFGSGVLRAGNRLG